MEAMPEIWTADEIAKLLGLSRRHVVDRVVHDPKFPRPLNGCHWKKRWFKDEILAWVRDRR